MRGAKVRWAALAAVLWGATAAPAVDAPVRSVVVYPGGAWVEREARAEVPAGPATWELGPLAPEADPWSLAASVVDGRARIRSVAVATRPAVEAPTGRERELEARIQDLLNRAGAEADRAQALERRLSFIDALTRAPERADPTGDPAAWKAGWEALSAGAEEALAAIRAARAEESRLRKDAEALQRELDGLRTGRRDRRWALVELAVDEAGPVGVRLGYRVGGAGWTPATEARLDPGAGRVALETAARVEQRSGEDWADVELAVATADPRRTPEPPAVAPWFVDLWEPRPLAAKRDLRPMELAAAPAPVADGAAAAQTAAGITVYRVPGRVTVPSGAPARRVPLSTRESPARVFVRAVPQEATRAFVMAEFTYEGEGIVPEGRVDLYRGPHYVGAASVPALRPGETVTWAFGPDDQVDVGYEIDRDFKEQAGFFGGKRRIERRYRIRIVNRHPEPVEAEVVVRTPVSRDERLELSLEGSTPPDEDEFQGLPGVVAWRRTLGPGKEEVFVFRYAASFPKDLRPSGL